MGKLVLLSNFRDGYPEMIKKVADKESVIFPIFRQEQSLVRYIIIGL